MIPLCRYDNIAITHYSSLASGRLSRNPCVYSKSLSEDYYTKLKYDSTKKFDLEIINRFSEIASDLMFV